MVLIMTATIRDISQATTVSPSTVSRVLNGKGRIGSDTRKRVEAAARKLGYQPRRPGRPSLSKSKAVSHIGVVYPKHPNASKDLSGVFAQWMMSAREKITNDGNHFSAFVGCQTVDEDSLLKNLVEQGEIDGLILMGSRSSDGYLPWAIQTRLPLVVVNRRPEHEQFSYVGMDNFGGGRLAAQHLCQLGHKKFAYVDFLSQQNHQKNRQAGFIQGLHEHGRNLDAFLQFDPFQPGDSGDSAKAVVKQIQDTGITGIFCFNNSLARVIEQEMAKQGINVPNDCSIIGFDYLNDLNSSQERQITTIGCDAQKTGRYAAKMIFDLISAREDKPFLACTVAVELIQRDTTAPPPRI